MQEQRTSHFLLLLPKFYFWKGNWTLGYGPNQFGNFLNISKFCESWAIQQLVLRLMYTVYCAKYQVLFNVMRIKPVLKFFKVPKYYHQDCQKTFLWVSTSLTITQLSENGFFWLKDESCIGKTTTNQS